MLMIFYSVVFGFISFHFLFISCRFVVCSYQVLRIYQAMFIAVHFKLMVTKFEHILKPVQFLLTFSMFMFLSLFFNVCACVGMYPLIYCCNYTWSSYFCLGNLFISFKVVQYTAFTVCLHQWEYVSFLCFIIYIFDLFFLKKSL